MAECWCDCSVRNIHFSSLGEMLKFDNMWMRSNIGTRSCSFSGCFACWKKAYDNQRSYITNNINRITLTLSNNFRIHPCWHTCCFTRVETTNSSLLKYVKIPLNLIKDCVTNCSLLSIAFWVFKSTFFNNSQNTWRKSSLSELSHKMLESLTYAEQRSVYINSLIKFQTISKSRLNDWAEGFPPFKKTFSNQADFIANRSRTFDL